MDELEYFLKADRWVLLLDGREIGAIREREDAETLVKGFKARADFETEIKRLKKKKEALEEELKELRLGQAELIAYKKAVQQIGNAIEDLP